MKVFQSRKYILWFAAFLILLNGWLSVTKASARDETPTPQNQVSTQQSEPPVPSQIMEAVNALRISHGIAPLAAHPVLMQVGQFEANGIASGNSGHWRPDELTLGQWLISLGYPLSGDLSLDGYRSENWGFAQNADEAITMWLGDDEHTNTMLSVDRSDIGVGIAFSTDNGSYVIVLETALQTRSGKQQSDAYAIMTGIPQTKAAYSDISTQAAKDGLLPQNMLPVTLNTALADGNVYHEVKYGQTLWSIAVTYKTTIKQIQQLNHLSDTTVQPGQKLLVLKGATQPAPRGASTTGIAVLPVSTFSTPTVIEATETPTPEIFRESSLEDKQKNTLGILSIAIAALFLGALFAVMMKKKQI